MKKKIIMFGQKRIPSREGGVEIVVEELATRMAALGNEVTVYNRKGHHVAGAEFDKKKYTEYKGVQIKTVPTINQRGLAAVSSSFFAALKASFSTADVIHIHAEGPALVCWLPKLFGKKIIVTIHGLDWQREKWGKIASWYIKTGEKQAVKYANQIIVLSKSVQEYFHNTYNRDTIFIPNGVVMHEKKCGDVIKEKWDLTNNSYVLYVGRIVPEKGLTYLIQAWKNVKTTKKLVIAGGSSDTLSFLKKLKKDASDNVIFTGFVQGEILSELYSNAYIYCLPSDLEGMPLSLLEAMSYGNCCLTSDIPECTEVVGNVAVTFRKSNTQDLAQKLQDLINDNNLVDFYKKNSANYICSKYNWDEIVNKTLDLYD